MVWVIKGWMISLKVGIKFKLISFTATLLFGVIALLSFFVLSGIKSYQEKEVEAILIKQRDMFEQYYSDGYIIGNNKSQTKKNGIFNKPWLRTIPANIYDKEGELLSGFITEENVDENDNKATMIQYAIEGKVSYVNINDVVYFYSPIKYEDEIVAVLELQYTVEDNTIFYNSIKYTILGTGVAMLLVGIALILIYFFSFTRDIYKMKNSVENIKNGDFDKVELVKRNDEIGELSKGLIYMNDTIKGNIMELKVERDTLSIAVDKLKKMDAKQKEFIGNVTHEFKTPITTIKAYADLIGMYKEDLGLIEEGTNNISKECDRLASMVDRVLNLSALEKYDFEIKKSEINIAGIINEICERMKGKIKRNDLVLNCRVDDITITLDEESFRQIIINLIDNAIKYNTKNGSINIQGYRKDSRVYIVISDTGIGIPDKDLGKIFEPYYRVENHRSRETGGVGLGLALVKKLVEIQNGSITVESVLNQGTSFIIKF